MLSSEVKALISAAVELYSTVPLTQALIDEGINKLIDAKELLINQKENSEGQIENKYKRWLFNPLLSENIAKGDSLNSIKGIVDKGSTIYNSSDYVEIPDGVKTISVVNAIDNQVGYHVFNVYDKDKKFIKGSYKNTSYDWYFDIPNNADYDHIDFELPEGSKYIRFGSSSAGNVCGAYYLSDTPEIIEFIHESNNEYTVNTVKELKTLDVKSGDIVTTLGYNKIGDEGNAVYDIITYEEFYHLLPNDIKLLKSNNKIIKTPVDEFGNHTLNNGLIAKLRLTGETTPEQWGAVAQESFNSCQAFVHMFAHIKTGKIKLKKDGVYCLGLIYNEDTINSFKDNPYKAFMTGNLLGGQLYSKPIMANIHEVEFIGDNTTITIPENVFGNNGMGILNFAGKIDGLKFEGINFDGKGRCCNYPNKNSNHTIFYTPATVSSSHPATKDIHPLLCEGSLESDKGSFKNFEINNCYFYDAGAMYRQAGDYGGDFILIVNPTIMNNVNIHHNRFEAWGRWVFAIDLGGQGECLKNIKFNNNVCIGANAYEEVNEDGSYKYLINLDKKEFLKLNPNYTEAGLDRALDNWRWRGLGFIDFEAKKCFDNVELIGNTIIGPGGWAINGNSKVSRNFLIKDNYWKHVGGGYPYGFELYSGMSSDITFENNQLHGVKIKPGLFTNNFTFVNNYITNTIRTFGLAGTIRMENNRTNENSVGILWEHVSNNYYDDFIPMSKAKEDRIKVIYKNNDCFFSGNFNNFTELEKDMAEYFDFDVEYNEIRKSVLTAFNTNLEIDLSKVKYSGQQVIFNGAQVSSPYLISDAGFSVVKFKKGQIAIKSLNKMSSVKGKYFKEDLVSDFRSYGTFGYNWGAYADKNGYKNIDLVCIEEGYLPGTGEYGFANQCTHVNYLLNSGKKLDNTYICTDDDVYFVSLAGKLFEIPTHKEGKKIYTHTTVNKDGTTTEDTIELFYIGKLGKFELRCE